MFTVDANIWIAGYSPEESAYPECRRFLDRLISAQARIVLPHLAFVELVASVARKRDDAEMGLEFAHSVAELTFLEWVHVDEEIATAAADLAANYRLRSADAVYAAVAQQHRCTLVSLDRELLTRLPVELRALSPSDALSRVEQ